MELDFMPSNSIHSDSRLIWKIKRILRMKGGVNMSEMREFLFSAMEDLRKGDLPNETGGVIHLTAHRIVADKNADCRMVQIGLNGDQLRKAVKAMDKVKA